MTEVLLQPASPELTAPDQEALPAAYILDSVEKHGIVIEDRESVEASLQVLRQELGIQDEALQSTKRMLVLTAAAERLAALERTDVNVSTYGQEIEYVADIVMGIAGSYTPYGTPEDSLDTYVPSDEHQKLVYEKYTHAELSGEMEKFIHSDRFDALRRRLGVVNEQPFQVKVLTIEAGSGHGLVPQIGIGEGQLDYQEFNARVKENEYRRDYTKNLEKRTSEFVRELNREDVFAPAWVSTFSDGTQYLCITSPLAEKVLYTEEERADYYTTDDRVRDLAVLEHEYTHTQAMITEGELGLGIALEELRAEYFSGNKQGYTDIKKYFAGMKMLTGYNPAESFEIDGRPYSEDEFMADIARRVGLQGLLDAMAAIPGNYAEDEAVSSFVKSIIAHNGGGLSGQFRKLYEYMVNKDGNDVVEARISKYVDGIYDQVKDMEYISTESWFAYGGIRSLRDIAIDNFRTRHPEKSDNWDYNKS